MSQEAVTDQIPVQPLEKTLTLVEDPTPSREPFFSHLSFKRHGFSVHSAILQQQAFDAARRLSDIDLLPGELVGEVHFEPGDTDPTTKLDKLIKAGTEYFKHVDGRKGGEPRVLYGHTNEEMAKYAAEKLGFVTEFGYQDTRKQIDVYRVVGDSVQVRERFEALAARSAHAVAMRSRDKQLQTVRGRLAEFVKHPLGRSTAKHRR